MTLWRPKALGAGHSGGVRHPRSSVSSCPRPTGSSEAILCPDKNDQLSGVDKCSNFAPKSWLLRCWRASSWACSAIVAANCKSVLRHIVHEMGCCWTRCRTPRIASSTVAASRKSRQQSSWRFQSMPSKSRRAKYCCWGPKTWRGGRSRSWSFSMSPSRVDPLPGMGW